MSKEKSASLLSNKISSTLQVVLVILLAILIGALVANFIYLGKKSSEDKKYTREANNLRVYSQVFSTNALKALRGDTESFALLSEARTKFDAELSSINLNIKDSQVQIVLNNWTTLKGDVNSLLNAKDGIINLNSNIDEATKIVSKLQSIVDETFNKLKADQGDIKSIIQAQQASLQLGSIQYDLNDLMVNFSGAEKLTASLNDKVSSLNSSLNTLKQSGVLPSAAQRILLETTDYQTDLLSSVKTIFEIAPSLVILTDLENNILSQSKTLLNNASILADNIDNATSVTSSSALLNYVLIALIILTVLAITLLIEKRTRGRLQATSQENAVNQEAILQLLDEIGDLAEGDLTVNATVSEAFTGAIADSINYSIEQLRGLVQTINDTSVRVSDTARASQDLAMNLAEAAEHQAGEIAGVSTAINEMANSIDNVSNTALESENVAKRSVEIAHNGSQIVHNTISGMDIIREQIQDTSKRIKRLGESSQEIGEIIGLIDDISEQTNILALNAAIQASMAGEAGRGFAVVADEVQRLAERSSAATKQIESLVKTIQTDTNEAVVSMEQTTSEVVRGAKLTENAGVALEEIENVSQALATLIQTISKAARQQSSTATHISKTMNVIQEITTKTSSGSTETAVNIGRLANLSNEMQESVKGFTLPNN